MPATGRLSPRRIDLESALRSISGRARFNMSEVRYRLSTLLLSGNATKYPTLLILGGAVRSAIKQLKIGSGSHTIDLVSILRFYNDIGQWDCVDGGVSEMQWSVVLLAEYGKWRGDALPNAEETDDMSMIGGLVLPCDNHAVYHTPAREKRANHHHSTKFS